MLEYLSSLPGTINQGLIWGLMAIGVFITFKILDIADLTVDGSFAMGGLVCAMYISSGGNFIVGLLLGFLSGLACGLITGLLHTVLGIPAILAGILTQLSCWSLNLAITRGVASISIYAGTTQVLISQLDKYNSLWKLSLILAAIILILYLFFGTELGAAIRATGCNQKMAKAQGINTKLNIVLGLMISNGIVALAGALLAQYQGAAEVNMGRGAIVIGLCAIVVGQAIFSKISSNFALRMFSVLFGGVIYFLIFDLVLFIHLDTNYLKMLTAIVVGIVLGIPYIKTHYISRIKKRTNNQKIKNTKVEG